MRRTFDLDVAGLRGGEPVPAVFAAPRSTRAVPGVLLLHGFSSRKEVMIDSVGAALVRRGVAALAVDLPLHGARRRTLEALSLGNAMTLIRAWRQAVAEAHAALAWLAAQPEIDHQRIGIAGYSLGSYLAVVVASENRLVRAIALASGGDLPEQTPFAGVVRTVADPLRAVRALAGRPLLMVNGRNDRTIKPAQARALYAAAGEPKEQRWYAGGHWPPPNEIAAAADWLAQQLVSPQAQAREA